MLSGRFSLLAVTTLEKLLLSSELGGKAPGGVLKLVAIEEQPVSLVRAFAASLGGKLGRSERARSPFRGSQRDHHRGRQLERDPRRRDLPRRARTADPPAARAAAVVRQAGGLSHAPCRELRALVAEELSLPVDPRVTAMAEAIAAKHGDGVARGAVLRIVPARSSSSTG